jgi:transcriptional regulator with XRE-family HTH domain
MPGRKRRNIHTLRAQWLGQHLRKLRENNGLTLRDAGEYVQRSLAAISRYELAEWPIRRGDVLALLDLYQVHDEAERRRLIDLADDVWRTDEWDREYGELIDRSFVDVPWLEARSDRIYSYDPMWVPGLLQTKEYAEAVIRGVEGPDARPGLVERGVALRLDRQAVLEGRQPTRLDAIVDEAALRRHVGGAAVMRGQLAHLVTQARRRHVTLRVMRYAAGAHPGFFGAFRVFALPHPYPEVGYVESLGGRLYLEPPTSARFVQAYDRLRQAALDPAASADLIATIAEDFDE